MDGLYCKGIPSFQVFFVSFKMREATSSWCSYCLCVDMC